MSTKRKHVTTVAKEDDGYWWVRCTCSNLSIDGPLGFKSDATRSKKDHEIAIAPPSPYEPEYVPSYWDNPTEAPAICTFCGLPGHTKAACETRPLAATQ